MKNCTVKLYSLKEGEWGKVMKCVDNGRNIATRLEDLGFYEGATVACLMKSPLGDPSAYLVSGSVIALRKEDAEAVTVSRGVN